MKIRTGYIQTGYGGILAHDPRPDKIKNLKKPWNIKNYSDINESLKKLQRHFPNMKQKEYTPMMMEAM